MTLHIRIDQSDLNSGRRFACGIGPELPKGDSWAYQSESLAGTSDCLGCNPAGPRKYGVPAISMNGNAAARHDDPVAWGNWVRFCNACGHP